MFPEIDDLRARVATLEKKLAVLEQDGSAAAPVLYHSALGRGTRKRSKSELFGVPLWEIALGPDPSRGEQRGHAKAIFAMGDIATGLFAFGGVARGGFCFGGVAIGLVTFGGVSLGLLTALGGCAIGLGFSAGGLAIGTIAIGGAAFGLFAVGGLAVGIERIGPPLGL
jgi:hypothetical protein